MDKSTWRFQLKTDTVIHVLVGAKVLTVQIQYGQPVLWALVDRDCSTLPRRFIAVPTSTTIDSPVDYVTTVQMGNLVFHFCEVPVED